ncbi:hypothetical protein ACFLSE_03610 [Bacteroidota bacterium]
MKNLIKLLSIVFLFGAFFASCEGPEGPAGADASAECMECHNDGTEFSAKQSEFNASAHSLGTYFNRDGECAGCHSTEGFLARADFTSITEIYDLPAGQSAISCRTCHTVHTAYDETDWTLTFIAQVTETIFGSKNTTDLNESISFADYGNGNMCLQCHQARDRGGVPTVTSTDAVATSSHWGPHYGVQGNVLVASGGVNIPGDEDYPTATEGHATLSEACISCHMVDGDHTLGVNFDACATCHGSADDAEDLVDDLHDEIDALKFELGRALAEAGAMKPTTESAWVWDDDLGVHVEEIDTTGYVPSGTVTAAQARAVYNYMVVYQDHSYGVHNPSYVRALLNNSLDALK